jgi:hypothetical protein
MAAVMVVELLKNIDAMTESEDFIFTSSHGLMA